MVSFKLNIFSATSYSKKKMFGWNRRFRYLQKKGKDKKMLAFREEKKNTFFFFFPFLPVLEQSA